MTRKMALVGEACAQRYRGERLTISQQLLGMIDANLGLVRMRRHAHLFAEDTMKVIWTQVRQVAKVGERNRFPKMLFDVLPRAGYSSPFARACLQARATLAVREQCLKELKQQFLLQQLVFTVFGSSMERQELLPNMFVTKKPIARIRRRELATGDLLGSSAKVWQVYVPAAKTNVGTGGHPIFVNFAGRRDDEVTLGHQM